MSKKKKQAIMAGCLLGVSAVVMFLQYRPTREVDADIAAHPQVQEVVDAAQKQDTQQLAALAKSTDDVVSGRAITALARVGGPEGVRDFMSDRRPQVRATVAAGLGYSASPAALPALQQLTKDSDPSVRSVAVSSLVNIDDFRIFEPLMQMLSDPDVSVRRSAIQAIEARSGLLFPDYKPDGSNRGAAIGRIRAQISKMQHAFEDTVAYKQRMRNRAKR